MFEALTLFCMMFAAACCLGIAYLKAREFVGQRNPALLAGFDKAKGAAFCLFVFACVLNGWFLGLVVL